MAETAAVISRDEEEIQNSSNDEDRFPTHDAVSAYPGCSASPSLDSVNEDKRSSAEPERLSVLSSRAVAQLEALTGSEMVSGGQAQRTAPGLAKRPLAAVDALLGASSCPAAVDNLLPLDLASLHAKSSCYHGKLSSKVLQAPRLPAEASVAAWAGTDVQQAGSGIEGSMASYSLGRIVWMKTTTVMQTLENKKKEEKEKYRLQLAMYRRLLLLRSIRSLHRQLEQQQARLQECYGVVINTKKEVLKHIGSTLPSPSL
ncbi:hypothetical protein DUI87_08346 [Hirundo rustica rustica]|uniref:Uncharacterized protein n=1 Tax=Hirundo rustica rustica TaxID=333673 RepID=A0A3M0KXG1_HIRRU|nr:UPF0500 protein C1orf216 homolog [Hirundo rustica]RMC16134.1 hypothetical protein DUI87_08346 [Hirundo rustica rustica]